MPPRFVLRVQTPRRAAAPVNAPVCELRGKLLVDLVHGMAMQISFPQGEDKVLPPYRFELVLANLRGFYCFAWVA
jgi:hypothetical protein